MKFPEGNGCGEPDECGDGEDECGVVRGEESPEEDGEEELAECAECGSGGVYSDGGAAAVGSVTSYLLLALFFVLLDESGGGGEDGWEGEEESCDGRAEVLCDESGDEGDEAAEDETDCVFVGTNFFERGYVDRDAHGVTAGGGSRC